MLRFAPLALAPFTHELRLETINGVRVINPGSAHGFDTKATVAILDMKTKEAEILDV